jgi:hypothetical protein
VRRNVRHDVIVDCEPHVRVPREVPLVVHFDFREYRLHAKDEKMPVYDERAIRRRFDDLCVQ